MAKGKKKEGKAKQQPKPAPKKRGRPSTFTKALGNSICLRISTGESLRSICRDDKMPAIQTVLGWLYEEDKKEFRVDYELARAIQSDVIFEEIVEIADESGRDYVEVKKGKRVIKVFNVEAVMRSRLRVDARKWYLARQAPKKFADTLDLTTKGKELKQPRGAVINYVVPAAPKAV